MATKKTQSLLDLHYTCHHGTMDQLLTAFEKKIRIRLPQLSLLSMLLLLLRMMIFTSVQQKTAGLNLQDWKRKFTFFSPAHHLWVNKTTKLYQRTVILSLVHSNPYLRTGLLTLYAVTNTVYCYSSMYSILCLFLLYELSHKLKDNLCQHDVNLEKKKKNL